MALRFLVIALLSAFVIPHSSFAAQPLNVLFIAVNDLRQEIGCYGAEHMKTPHLDQLAASGMLFERAYCQVAVCNPSRNSVLSGTRPDTTGIFDKVNKEQSVCPEWHGIKAGFRRKRLISAVRQAGMRSSETLGAARF
ncbi:MAG TPA: hypothetical protein DIT64_15680 [Verrucomicrobiales bacterium]|nr:hypothetical protein [Verrucomicrobiales bacterium]